MEASDKDEIIEECQPTIVLKDRRTNVINAHVVEEKGQNEYAIQRIVQDLAAFGYNYILKSDGELALVALKQAVQRERPDNIILEQAPVGESKSNGEIENAVKQVQGKFRTLKNIWKGRLRSISIETMSSFLGW